MERHARSAQRSRNRASALAPVCLLFVLTSAASSDVPAYLFPEPVIDGLPKHYICCKTDASLDVDGRLDEPAWRAAPWTDQFMDIEGDLKPAPRFSTRVKMLWDDHFFYVAAEMEEPNVWAKLTDRDAVIFYDNDFEVFIDPDGDTHEYYELEVNAFGTEWDLLLTKPYRDDGTAIDSWDIQGLRTGIWIDGTLNDPGDTDTGWSVELAIPWAVLEECAHKPTPPEDGDQWRINFSRVEWRTEVVDGGYVKVTEPESGRPLPEDNWVWSPQGLINMHYPEMWGFVQFSSLAPGTGETAYVPNPAHAARAALVRLYYRERTFFGNNTAYTDDLEALRLGDAPVGVNWPPAISVTPGSFEASVTTQNGTTLHISQDGHIW
ncbi:MAG: carbohydrate-binding family 9-like protein [Candidatus Eisenbacteria sp.]|nr:carbohydrate-binding family 9-like protein [Candidatus Eisenbacteria bacterium]